MSRLVCDVAKTLSFDLKALPPQKSSVEISIPFIAKNSPGHVGIRITSIKELFPPLYNKASSVSQNFKTTVPWSGHFGEDVLTIQIVDGSMFNSKNKPKPNLFDGKTNCFLVKVTYNQVAVVMSEARKILREGERIIDDLITESELKFSEHLREIGEKAKADLRALLLKTVKEDPVDTIDVGQAKGSREYNDETKEESNNSSLDDTLAGDPLNDYDN